MKKLILSITLLASLTSFAAEISDLKGCVISLPQVQNVREFPTRGLSGARGDVLFEASPEDSFYVVNAGLSAYSLGFLSVEYLRVISTEDITKGGYLTYKTNAYKDGIVDFKIDKCGATFGLVEMN